MAKTVKIGIATVLTLLLLSGCAAKKYDISDIGELASMYAKGGSSKSIELPHSGSGNNVQTIINALEGVKKEQLEEAVKESKSPVLMPESKPLIIANVESSDIKTPRGDDTYAVISVPASTTPTVIYVSKKSKSWKNTLVPFKDIKTKEVEVISDKPIDVLVPEVTPWWYYVLGLLIAATTVYILIQKYLSLITPFVTWIPKIVKWLPWFR